MSNNNDTSFTIDTEVFGLPTNVNNDATPGFMYGEDDLGVDENDPIYQATVEAMKARGVEVPKPDEQERPLELKADDGEVGAEDASDDAADLTIPAADPTIEPPAEDAPVDDAGTHLDLEVDGQKFSLNPQQAEYLLRVNTWLETLPDETKQQWAGIEQGTHVAISAQEYADLKAQAASPQPLKTPGAPDLDDLDDDTAEYIRSLEARVPQHQQGGQFDNPGQPSPAELQAAFRRQEEQRTVMMQELATINESYRSKYNLSDEQIARLEQVTAELRVIPTLQSNMTQFSPTGQVIRQPAFSEVVDRAYEIAMSQDPTLRQIRDDIAYNARVAKDADRNQATNAKKAKAGTLASTPSAAVPASGNGAPSIGPGNKMDLNATSEAIARALSQMSEQS